MRIFIIILALLISSCGSPELAGVIVSKEHQPAHIALVAGKYAMNVPDKYLVELDTRMRQEVAKDVYDTCFVGDVYPDCVQD